MIKMLRYMMSSWRMVLLILALLVIQAVCELGLPEYTSEIVDVGIQQNGIE